MKNSKINRTKDNERKNMMGIILVYVMFSVSGLLLLKIGTTRAFSLTLTEGNLDIKISGILLIGMCLYLLALITSLIAMKTIDLSIFYPISAGLGYVLVCLLSYLVLREHITRMQLGGMLFILIGVVLMNLRK